MKRACGLADACAIGEVPRVLCERARLYVSPATNAPLPWFALLSFATSGDTKFNGQKFNLIDGAKVADWRQAAGPILKDLSM